jgi:hypothetical protein
VISGVAVDGGNSGKVRILSGVAGKANANNGVRNGKILEAKTAQTIKSAKSPQIYSSASSKALLLASMGKGSTEL